MKNKTMRREAFEPKYYHVKVSNMMRLSSKEEACFNDKYQMFGVVMRGEVPMPKRVAMKQVFY